MGDQHRQTGRTTRQMLDASTGAIYVWPTAHLHYPRSLAFTLGRTNLVIMSARRFLASEPWRGRDVQVVVDHAVWQAPGWLMNEYRTADLMDTLHYLEARNRRVNTDG